MLVTLIVFLVDFFDEVDFSSDFFESDLVDFFSDFESDFFNSDLVEVFSDLVDFFESVLVVFFVLLVEALVDSF